MEPNYLELIHKYNNHSILLDEAGLCRALQDCYLVGKEHGIEQFLEWLSKMDYLSDNINYIIEEWKNQKS